MITISPEVAAAIRHNNRRGSQHTKRGKIAQAVCLAFGINRRTRGLTRDLMGASVELRTAIVAAVISIAGANARIKLYNGARPATGGTPAGTLLATLIMGATLGTANNGALDIDEASMTQNNATHVPGTPTWFRIEKASGTFVADFSIPDDGTFGGAVVANTNVTLNPSTITAPNA